MLLLFAGTHSTFAQHKCHVFDAMVSLASGPVEVHSRRIFDLGQFGAGDATSVRISESVDNVLH